MIQSGLDLYIYCPSDSESSWITLKVIDNKKLFVIANAKPIFVPRKNSSLANFRGTSIFLSGGCYVKDLDSKSNVFQYRVSADSWTACPELNQSRERHSSCVVKDSLYICGGFTPFEPSSFLTSVERLRVREDARYDAIDYSGRFETLNVATPPFHSFLMVPSSASNEILFLGGSVEEVILALCQS